MMNEEEIIAGNKLCAEFMGVGIKNNYIIELATDKKIGVGEYDEFLYHSSWDWIMPCVEKIEGRIVDLSVTVIIKNNICSIIRHYKSPYEEGICWMESESKIQSTYQAVVQFIQWYNQPKTT